jgi:uncharacterized membrane protein
VTRGVWLVLMELTVINFAWSYCWAPFLQVIWAVGMSMVGLGLIVRLPTWAIGGLGAAILLFHNLLDPIRAKSLGHYADLWRMVHEAGSLTYNGHEFMRLYYPVLPWFGIICVGYAFGMVASEAPARRRRIAVMLSACFLTAFTLLRVFHGYGDPFQYQHLATPARTAMSFLQVLKYPPSLHYALATFGVLLLMYAGIDLAASRDWLPKVRTFFETFGRVPFFYYVPHIYLIHTLAILATMAVGLNWHFWFTPGLMWDDQIPA